MQGSAFIQFHERKFLSSLLKSCEIEVVEITDNGLVKSISVFQRNNVSVWDLENYDYFPLYSALFVRIPDRILPQDTSCCEDTWILHPGPLKGSIYTSIHTGQLHYVNLFFWLIIVKTKVKVRWNSILSVQFSEEKKSEVNSRQQVLPCPVLLKKIIKNLSKSSGMKLLYCNIFPIYLAIKRNKLFRYTQILWFQIFGLWDIASECILTKVLDRWSWSIIDTWCRRLARYLTLAQLIVRKVRNYELGKPSKKTTKKLF